MKAKPETSPIWKSTGNTTKDNELSVKAFRFFKTGMSERDLKLGETRRWTVGFFDMSGPSAFSDIMKLNLSDNVEQVNKQKEAEQKAAA